MGANMQLSTSDKVKMFAAFGAVVITIIAHILIREWYLPYIRYELGSHYISGASAITFLKLSNMGHSDAEKIRLVATFNKKIIEITSDNKAIPFKILDGGVGKKYISGEIDRLVPQQNVYIYFALAFQAPLTSELNKNFLQEITFKGGKGKTGKPFWENLFSVFLTIITIISINYIFIKLSGKKNAGKIEEYHNHIFELISVAENCYMEGKTDEEFKHILKEYLKDIEFRKKGLEKIAIKKYKNLTEIKTNPPQQS